MADAADLAEIVESLFHGEWYLQRYPDVAAVGADPFEHYVAHGAREGRNPNPLFGTTWYVDQLGGHEPQLDPLTHFVLHGAGRGLDPHPLFRTEWYARQVGEIGGMNPLAHYLRFGATALHDPHPLFQAKWYLKNNPDVARAAVNPLLHYLRDGEKEGRNPNPLFDIRWYARRYFETALPQTSLLEHYIVMGAAGGYDPHPLFDGAWYVSKLDHDLTRNQSALEHYMINGARNRIDPHPLFDADWYTRTYPEVRAYHSNPLVHYLEEGIGYGTEPHPLFRGYWYRSHYGQAEEISSIPLLHFLEHAADKGYDPGPDFSTRWYMDRYGDVDWTRINPLVHYVVTGRQNGHVTLPVHLSYGRVSDEADQVSGLMAIDRHRHMKNMTSAPTFIVIVDGTDDERYDATIESIRTQTYSNLTIVQRSELSKHSDRQHGAGWFLLWLRAGDILKGTALYNFASAIIQDPSLDMIYADEEIVDDDHRVTPFFKPAWSPDHLLSFNFVGRAACYRMSSLDDRAFEAGDPFAFLLGALRSAKNIAHLREIVVRCPDRRYGSDAEITTDIATLTDACARYGPGIVIAARSGNARRYTFTSADARPPKVSVVIYDDDDSLDQAGRPAGEPNRAVIESLEAILRYDPIEIIDLGGRDAGAEDRARVRVLGSGSRPPNRYGLARSLNTAMEGASGEYVLFLDALYRPASHDFLDNLVGHFHKPFVGAAGPIVRSAEATILQFGQVLCEAFLQDLHWALKGGINDYFFSHTATRNFRLIGLNGLVTRRSVLTERGGFNPEICDRLIAADYCLDLVEKGLTIVGEPRSELRRMHDPAHRSRRDHEYDVERDPVFCAHWAQALIAEPFYNDRHLSTRPAAFDGRQR